MSFIQKASSEAPPGYVTPGFPSLYWPLPIVHVKSSYLYHAGDIWRFTTLWTVLLFGGIHITAALWACIVQSRNWKVIWCVPIVYTVIGGIEGVIAGSVVGALLGAVYNAGYFRMSTWIPFVWACVNALVLILSSFAIQGGL